MRVKSTAGDSEYKLWLKPEEYEALCDVAEDRSHKHHAVALLGGSVGLRAQEMAAVRPEDMYADDGLYWLRVHEEAGKDTTGSGGKLRDAHIPQDAYVELLENRHKLDVEEDELLLGVTKSRVRDIVHELGDEMAARGDDVPGRSADWEKLSAHDLRRFFAQDRLVRKEMNPHTVMAIGGWSSLGAMEDYIKTPSDDVVADEIKRVGLS
ncbi:Phage integrase family protein [Natronoarchaeum philippinense]|uniref:Phage integrase family protein n=1 Tax=Natronoarchaeum philippinense TaxID=558529 RepID=A0A285NT13_NATPI|nr:site-specific integrase [Natronoarchaeum philippinense]SNZ12348.1 Phage integrase family protein [Natronoarchaeum philippinense]